MNKNMENSLLESRSFQDILQFCKELPKVELHAHLNGSLSADTLRELCRLSGHDAADVERYVCDDGHDWARLVESFSVAHRLTQSAAAVSLAVRRTVEEFCRDGCVHLELRSSPKPCPTRRDYIDAVLRGLEECSKLDISTRYLVSIDRRWPAEVVAEVVDLAVEYGRRSARVVGVDLSGDPAAGHFADFAPALQRARDGGLKITVHCSEVPSPAEEADVVSFRPDRVGHAVFLPPARGGAPDTWRRFVRSGVCVEACLTSNVVTGSVPSYEEHHVSCLQREGVPFVICTDDAGVFDTSLSQEYAVFAHTFARSRRELAVLARAACRHAFASHDEVRALEDRVDKFWKTQKEAHEATDVAMIK